MIKKLQGTPQPNMLVIGTTKWDDHFEIGVEIAILYSSRGWNVNYIFMEGAHDAFEFKPILMQRFKTSKIGKHLLNENYFLKTITEAKKISERIGIGSFNFSWIDAKDWKYKTNLYLGKIKNIDDLRSYSYKNFPLGQYIATSLTYLTANSTPNLVKYTRDLENIHSDAVNLTNFFCRFFNQESFQRVVLFNGRFHNSGPIYEVAKRQDLQVLFHEKGGWDRQSYFLETWRPQNVKKLGEAAKKQWNLLDECEKIIAKNRVIERLNVAREGGGLADKTFKMDLPTFSLPNANSTDSSENKNITFFTSSEDEFENLEETKLTSGFESQTDAIKILSAICDKIGLNLTVRIHPHLAYKHSDEQAKWGHNLSVQLGNSVRIISESSSINSYDLICNSRVVCVWNSTIALEAIHMGIPVLAFCESYIEESGADVIRVNNRGEVIEKILMALEYKVKKESILPVAYHIIHNGSQDIIFLSPVTLKIPNIFQPFTSKIFLYFYPYIYGIYLRITKILKLEENLNSK